MPSPNSALRNCSHLPLCFQRTLPTPLTHRITVIRWWQTVPYNEGTCLIHGSLLSFLQGLPPCRYMFIHWMNDWCYQTHQTTFKCHCVRTLGTSLHINAQTYIHTQVYIYNCTDRTHTHVDIGTCLHPTCLNISSGFCSWAERREIK